VAAGLEASDTLQENWTEVEVTLVTEMSGWDGVLWALAVTGPRTVPSYHTASPHAAA